MFAIWLSIEWQQFEINISRSLSVGISFLSLSKSFNNLKTKRALAKSLYRDSLMFNSFGLTELCTLIFDVKTS